MQVGETRKKSVLGENDFLQTPRALSEMMQRFWRPIREIDDNAEPVGQTTTARQEAEN
jgi:hypothetical protein